MARWQPDSPGRLAEAALELFEEKGFEQTTAAEIAARAGVTERTFFRHYADKREVLFAGGAPLNDAALAAIEAAAPLDGGAGSDPNSGASPFALATEAAVAAGAQLPPERLPFARRRQAVIESDPRLQERELLKLASLTATITDALVARGVERTQAALAAEAALAGFRVGFTTWVTSDGERSLAELVRDAAGLLSAVTAI